MSSAFTIQAQEYPSDSEAAYLHQRRPMIGSGFQPTDSLSATLNLYGSVERGRRASSFSCKSFLYKTIHPMVMEKRFRLLQSKRMQRTQKICLCIHPQQRALSKRAIENLQRHLPVLVVHDHAAQRLLPRAKGRSSYNTRALLVDFCITMA